MFPIAGISPDTQQAYSAEAWRLVEQSRREDPRGSAWSPLLDATRWFLHQDGRWSASTIRRYAVALAQEFDGLLEYDSFPPDSWEGMLRNALHNDRPLPSSTPKYKVCKNVPVREVRALTANLRSSGDEFDRWCAGYIVVATRLGWRPGEILDVERQGMLLVAGAEKYTNGRGLFETCQADLTPYGKRWLRDLDGWISNVGKFQRMFGGRKGLQVRLNSRLQAACRRLGIKRVCTYSFRHHAIASMKSSGLTREEIAVLVNHATNRTASDHYGKKRFGARRARRRWAINQARLVKVRAISRRHDPSKRSKAGRLPLLST